MRPTPLFFLAAAAVLASPGLAKEHKPVDPDKKVCRREVPTGSIMPGKRVCRTPAEWAAIDSEGARSGAAFHDRVNTPGALTN